MRDNSPLLRPFMTAKFFVTCAGLMISAWLAATYLRAVPMDTYTPAPTASQPASSESEGAMVASTVGEEGARLISTAP